MMFSEIRRQVVETSRLLADRGYLSGTGGNVAVRADQDHFAVTPSAIDFYDMTAADICVLKLDDLEQVAGELKPSVESGLHARILRARPDCGASVHTHQPIASAYTVLAQPLEVRAAEHQRLLGQSIPCAGYAPSGTGWLAKLVAKLASQKVAACLMRNHGVICLGRDESEATARADALEQAAAAYFAAQLEPRQRPQKLPAAVITAVRAATRS